MTFYFIYLVITSFTFDAAISGEIKIVSKSQFILFLLK